MAYSPDGQRLVTGAIDSLVKIWDAKTGQLQSTLSGHRGIIKGSGLRRMESGFPAMLMMARSVFGIPSMENNSWR